MNEKPVSIPVSLVESSKLIKNPKSMILARELMRGYLTSWYDDGAELFRESMRADLAVVLEWYHIYRGLH